MLCAMGVNDGGGSGRGNPRGEKKKLTTRVREGAKGPFGGQAIFGGKYKTTIGPRLNTVAKQSGGKEININILGKVIRSAASKNKRGIWQCSWERIKQCISNA